MENIVLEGRLLQLLPLQEGVSTRGAWKKQEFIVETNEQYPKKVCISVWNEKVDELARYKSGDQVKVSVNIESREYNSRWYTDIKAWRLEPLQAQESAAPAAGNTPAANDDDILGMSFSEEDEELPF